jgi:hypothetical protein
MTVYNYSLFNNLNSYYCKILNINQALSNGNYIFSSNGNSLGLMSQNNVGLYSNASCDTYGNVSSNASIIVKSNGIISLSGNTIDFQNMNVQNLNITISGIVNYQPQINILQNEINTLSGLIYSNYNYFQSQDISCNLLNASIINTNTIIPIGTTLTIGANSSNITNIGNVGGSGECQIYVPTYVKNGLSFNTISIQPVAANQNVLMYTSLTPNSITIGTTSTGLIINSSNILLNSNVSISGNIYNTPYNNNFINLNNYVTSLSGRIYNYSNNITCSTLTASTNISTNEIDGLSTGANINLFVNTPNSITMGGSGTTSTANIYMYGILRCYNLQAIFTSSNIINLFNNTTSDTINIGASSSTLNVACNTIFNNQVTFNSGINLYSSGPYVPSINQLGYRFNSYGSFTNFVQNNVLQSTQLDIDFYGAGGIYAVQGCIAIQSGSSVTSNNFVVGFSISSNSIAYHTNNVPPIQSFNVTFNTNLTYLNIGPFYFNCNDFTSANPYLYLFYNSITLTGSTTSYYPLWYYTIIRIA